MTRSFQIHLSNQISSNPSTNILSLVTFITDLTERHEQSPNLFPSLHRVLFFNRNARNILVFSKYMQCARFIIIINYCILALRTVLLDTRNARNARKQHVRDVRLHHRNYLSYGSIRNASGEIMRFESHRSF